MNRSWISGFNTAQIASKQSIAPTQAYKVGAALYSGNRLLSIGYNQFSKTHPRYAIRKHDGNDFDITLHAELMCLLRRQYYEGNKNLILYVYRGLANGKPGCSKPCPMCMSAIILASVKRIRFYNNQGIAEEIKL
jgi:tRNA(Arg) A34 adenosine deaminase TadA